MIMTRPSRDAVARWNRAYAEHTSALFAAMRATSAETTPVLRLVDAYHDVASAWRVLAADFNAPIWARHASSIAAEEFDRRGWLESRRLQPPEQNGGT